MSKLAIIDIGTNSIHMVLAEVGADFSSKILDRFKDMTRLGDGTFATRRLSHEAMARGLEVTRNLVTLAKNKGYTRILAVATSAVREAKNGGEFIEAIAQETGLTVRVITGLEEARLIFLGVKHSMVLSDKPTVVVDVGGGSVELMVGNRDAMQYAKSLKLGAIRLKDQWLQRTPPSKSHLQDMETVVREQLMAALRQAHMKRCDKVVATSGMAANLAEVIHLRNTGRPIPQLNLATVPRKEIEVLEHELAGASLKERLAIPGLDPKRVDTLLPAATVLRILLDLMHTEDLTICDRGIRDGMIYDFIERHRAGIRAELEIPDLRKRSVLSLARRCNAPEVHAVHVASLALRLFDRTKSLHGFGRQEREWLEYAAILHDVGYVINARQHHKHAYYLIKHSDLAGFAAEEIELIANVARYHRRAVPAKKHVPYGQLSSKQRRVVEVLSALLRIADALDRTHFSVVRTVDLKMGASLTLMVHATGDAEMELWAAKSRADLFERAFGRPVQFTVVAQNEEPS